MKEKMEENLMNIDDTELNIPVQEVKKEVKNTKVKRTPSVTSVDNENSTVNCLRNERIIVRHISKQRGIVTNPKHILYGGMAENAVRYFVVPRLQSGMFVNILTDSEKACLEEVMGLEYNALSVYKKVDNFWDDSADNGISRVRLTKHDTYLDLSNPEDYIRYKILLANKNTIAPSWQVLQDTPKATYQFVLISEGDEVKTAKDNMSSKMLCYKEFGKIEDNADMLRVILETIDGRPTSPSTKIEVLQTKINDIIQSNSKMFLKVIQDPMLSTKVLIKKSIEAGLIANRGNYLYMRDTNTPLCSDNEEPTLNIAAKFLNLPKNQDLKFALEAKLKQ